MKTVMVFGSFDVMHPGHLYFLKKAKKLGDRLVVVIALDRTIERIKQQKPKYNERERLEHIRGFKLVDKAVFGYEVDPYEIIEEINPDVICLGYDQDSFTDNLKEELNRRGVNPKIVRISAYKEEKYKSSILKANSY